MKITKMDSVFGLPSVICARKSNEMFLEGICQKKTSKISTYLLLVPFISEAGENKFII